MAMSPEKLASIITGKAAQLCSEQSNRLMDSIKTNKANNDYFNYNENDENFVDPYLVESDNTNKNTMHTPSVTKQGYENSNLPQAIKESMLNNQIDVSSMNPHNSILDRIGVPSQQKQQTRQVVNEVVNNNASYKTTNNSSNIDYTIIKAIIEECIDRKLNEFNQKQSLNENTLKTIGLAEGKIKLIDNKGNVYLSNLQYQGNLKDKKK